MQEGLRDVAGAAGACLQDALKRRNNAPRAGVDRIAGVARKSGRELGRDNVNAGQGLLQARA